MNSVHHPGVRGVGLERQTGTQAVAGNIHHGAGRRLVEHVAQLVPHQLLGLAGHRDAQILLPVLAVRRLGAAHHDHPVRVRAVPHAHVLAVKLLLPHVALVFLGPVGLCVVPGLDEAGVELVLLRQAVAPEGPQGRLGQRVRPGPLVPRHLVQQVADRVGDPPAHVRVRLVQGVRQGRARRVAQVLHRERLEVSWQLPPHQYLVRMLPELLVVRLGALDGPLQKLALVARHFGSGDLTGLSLAALASASISRH